MNCVVASDRSDVRGGGRPHLVPPGQGGLHHVLHVRGRAQAPHAVPLQPRLQPQRERVRLARERGGLRSAHPRAAYQPAEIVCG